MDIRLSGRFLGQARAQIIESAWLESVGWGMSRAWNFGELERWLHSERWLPPHLSLSEVYFAIATVVLFLPTVVLAHNLVVLLLGLRPAGQAQKKEQ